MLSVTINSGIIKFSEFNRKIIQVKIKVIMTLGKMILHIILECGKGLVVNQIIMGLLALHILCFIQHKILAHYLLDISLKSNNDS